MAKLGLAKPLSVVRFHSPPPSILSRPSERSVDPAIGAPQARSPSTCLRIVRALPIFRSKQIMGNFPPRIYPRASPAAIEIAAG